MILRLTKSISGGEPEVTGWSVVVTTFLGLLANMILARLIKSRIENKRHSLRYDQFAIRIFDWDGVEAADVVGDVLAELGTTDPAVLAGDLPPVAGYNLEVWQYAAIRAARGNGD